MRRDEHGKMFFFTFGICKNSWVLSTDTLVLHSLNFFVLLSLHTLEIFGGGLQKIQDLIFFFYLSKVNQNLVFYPQ